MVITSCLSAYKSLGKNQARQACLPILSQASADMMTANLTNFFTVSIASMMKPGYKGDSLSMHCAEWMGGHILYTPTPPPLKIAGVLRSKDCFLHPALRFPHISGFFLRGFCRQKPARFLKSHRFCRTEGLRKPNCAHHSRFSMVIKIPDCTYS